MCGTQSTPSELSKENPWIFDICCFCIPVKVGCFILAYIQLISLIFAGIVSLIGIFTGWILMVYRSSKEDQNNGKYMLIANSVLIAFILLSLPFTVVLIVGLHKDNRKYIKVYLLYSVICLMTCFLFFMLVVISTQAFVLDMLVPAMAIVINIYFLLVFRSHHIRLKLENSVI